MKDLFNYRKILETPDCPSGLQTGTFYNRVQDDCDGDLTQQLHVFLAGDGDMHIAISGDTRSLRFRNYFGGGMSLRTHRALMILAEAIRLDNEERPQS